MLRISMETAVTAETLRSNARRPGRARSSIRDCGFMLCGGMITIAALSGVTHLHDCSSDGQSTRLLAIVCAATIKRKTQLPAPARAGSHDKPEAAPRATDDAERDASQAEVILLRDVLRSGWSRRESVSGG